MNMSLETDACLATALSGLRTDIFSFTFVQSSRFESAHVVEYMGR